MKRKKSYLLLVVIFSMLVAAFGAASAMDSVSHVEVVKSFDASLGELPEGVAIDKTGNIYVSLGAPLGPTGEIRRIAPDGQETTVIRFENGPGPAGLAVDAPGNVYYAFFTLDERQGVYRLTPDGDSERLPGTEAILLPNGLAFDKQGNLYVSDSILGAVWRVPRGGTAELWLQHESLAGCGLTPGFPPIGANGVAYSHNALYVASTEQGLLVRVPVLPDGAAGDPEIVAGAADCDPSRDNLDSIDGIALDVHGDVFALLVIQNKLVKVDPSTGQVTELLNDEDGLFNPASIAFGTGKGDRQSVFIVNYALLPPEPPNSLGPAVLKVDVGTPGQPLP